MEIFLSLLFSPPKNSAIRYPHLGKEVAGLELAKIGVALDGGGGCVFFWSLGEVDEKGVEGEKKVAERLKKKRSALLLISSPPILPLTPSLKLSLTFSGSSGHGYDRETRGRGSRSDRGGGTEPVLVGDELQNKA
jgi:hypothetical protein